MNPDSVKVSYEGNLVILDGFLLSLIYDPYTYTIKVGIQEEFKNLLTKSVLSELYNYVDTYLQRYLNQSDDITEDILKDIFIDIQLIVIVLNSTELEKLLEITDEN